VNKREAFSIVVLVTLFAFSAMLDLSSAATYDSIGVEPGATATYAIAQRSTLGGGTYNFSATVTIESINGTRVTLRIREYLPNGTLSSDWLMTGDAATGGLMPFLIVANLLEGDPVFSGASARINETASITIAGTPRPANWVTMLRDSRLEECWDQRTGLLLIEKSYNPRCSSWRNWTLTSTTAFVGGGASEEAAALVPYLLAGAIGVMTTLVFAAIVADRRMK
jgi:hypothetical protein